MVFSVEYFKLIKVKEIKLEFKFYKKLIGTNLLLI